MRRAPSPPRPRPPTRGWAAKSGRLPSRAPPRARWAGGGRKRAAWVGGGVVLVIWGGVHGGGGGGAGLSPPYGGAAPGGGSAPRGPRHIVWATLGSLAGYM